MKNGNGMAAGRKHYGGGLYLQTAESGSASWLLRYQRGCKTNGKPAEHWLGLGPKSVFSLKQAKQRARSAQQQIYDDIDPLQAKREQRLKKALEDSRKITFSAATQLYYAGHEKKWSTHKHRQAFLNTLKQYADPIIGDWPVADIDTAAVLRIIEPIWEKKNQTASRIRGRVEAVLDWCAVHGYRSNNNPARWETLGKVLPASSEIAQVVHHKALPYADMPAFVAQLSQHKGFGPKALEFIILCASRTGEVLGARWNEFDFENKVWTCPAVRMKARNAKARKPHRVPLTGRMIRLLKSLPREGDDKSLVFIGTKPNKVLGKMVLPDLVDAMGHDTTIHGLRASFRTWAAESTAYPREVIEAALAHATGGEVELSYQRSDVLEKRRQLMEQWSAFISTPRKTGTVTPIRAKAGV
jgi:integrase